MHIARALLPPKTGHEVLAVYLSKGVRATTAVEGNTLTEADARGVVDDTLTLPKSRDYLQREIENVIVVLDEVKDDVLADPTRDLTPDDIRRINRCVLDGLRFEPGVVPGEIRTYSVTVDPRYRAPDATECSRLHDHLCAWMNSDDFTVPPEAPEFAAPLAILEAIVMHLYMASIHPFGDGNGCTARARVVAAASCRVSAADRAPALNPLQRHAHRVIRATRRRRPIARPLGVSALRSPWLCGRAAKPTRPNLGRPVRGSL